MNSWINLFHQTGSVGADVGLVVGEELGCFEGLVDGDAEGADVVGESEGVLVEGEREG